MRKLFDITLIQEDDIQMGITDRGEALVVPTGKGHFSGDEINGMVEPVGMGVVFAPAPGLNDLTSTMLLITDDGKRILMEMEGWFDLDIEAEKKMAKGESIPRDEYYHKGIVRFHTDGEKYKWLERKVCVYETEVKSWTELLTEVYMI